MIQIKKILTVIDKKTAIEMQVNYIFGVNFKKTGNLLIAI
jgi:hypothetical protein